MSNNAEQYTVKTPEPIEIKIGSLVKCLYGNSGNKFWTKHLEPFVEVQAISRSRKEEPPQLKFYGCHEWFYENDFRVISSEEIKSVIAEALTAYNLECKRNDDLQEEVETDRRLYHELWANHEKSNKELSEARKEIVLYRGALTELKRFAPSLSRLADDHLQYPVNCNRALANIETVLSKFQPKKDENVC